MPIPIPSLFSFIAQYNVFLFSGPLMLTIAACGWRRLWREKYTAKSRAARAATPEQHRLSTPEVTVIMLIGLVHFIMIYASAVNAVRFRLARVDQVTALRVEQLSVTEGTPTARVVRLEDAALVQAGLSLLASAESRQHNHESFTDGYRVQLLFGREERPSNLYLSVFRSTRHGKQVDVVIPHIGPEHAGSVHNAGEYSCPAFQQWIRAHVDPLFAARQ